MSPAQSAPEDPIIHYFLQNRISLPLIDISNLKVFKIAQLTIYFGII